VISQNQNPLIHMRIKSIFELFSPRNCKWLKVMLLFVCITSLSSCNLINRLQRTLDNATIKEVWQAEASVVKIPFKLLNDHIVMPVSINGGKTLNFIFDSGATTTVIFESNNTKELKLNLSFPIYLSGGGQGKSATAYNVRETNIAIGDLELQGASIVYLPLESIHFFKELDEVYFDGVIGYDFLKRFPIEINYEQMLVSIYRNKNSLPNLTDNSWQSLKLDIESELPILKTQLQTFDDLSVPVKLILDTGYTDPLLINITGSNPLTSPIIFYSASLKGISGRETIKVAETKTIKLGSYSVNNFPAFYAKSEKNGIPNGVLGNKILSQFNIIFDYDRERIFIKPNKRFGMLIPMDRSGLQVYPHKKGAYIDDVAINTGGSQLGLKSGDIIVSFNETVVNNITLAKLQTLLTSDDKSINICWITESSHNCGVLNLSDRIRAY